MKNFYILSNKKMKKSNIGNKNVLNMKNKIYKNYKTKFVVYVVMNYYNMKDY